MCVPRNSYCPLEKVLGWRWKWNNTLQEALHQLKSRTRIPHIGGCARVLASDTTLRWHRMSMQRSGDHKRQVKATYLVLERFVWPWSKCLRRPSWDECETSGQKARAGALARRY